MNLFLRKFLLAGVLLAVAMPAAADTLVLNDTSTIQDFWMWSGGAFSNNTGESSIQLQNNADDGGGGHYLKHVFIRFDLSGMPSGSNIVVDSAIYSAATTAAGHNADTVSIGVYNATKPWVEDEANWSEYSSGNAWDTAGGDYDATPTNTFTLGAIAAYTYFTMDFTAIVQSWVDGSETNNGLLLKYTSDDVFGQILMTGSECSIPGSGYQHLAPYLTITYHEVPEPATMSLLGLGGLGLLMRRKRS